jgi:hypothetical protein
MPLAPGLFSTMICVPFLASSEASRRTYWSVPPPAAKGTTMRMGCCACAEPAPDIKASPSNSGAMSFR